jgi:hypothetical protein
MSTLYGMMSGGPQTQESQRVPFFPSVNRAKILNTCTLAYQTNQLLSGHCRLNGYQYRLTRFLSVVLLSYRRENRRTFYFHMS